MKTKNPPIAISVLALLMAAIFFGIPHSHAKGVDPEEKVEYYLYDHLGGVDAILDEQGNVTERRDYLPYGEERVAEAGGTDKDRHGFTGKELDGESGLYYYGARYYDPALGRFASLDPLVLGESAKPLASVLQNPQALNGYGYALNNPVRYVDPTGQWERPVHFDGELETSRAAGFSDSDSLKMAIGDQGTDVDPVTSPWNLDNGWKHFVSTDVATMWLDEGVRNKVDLETFGQLKHYYADSFCHDGCGYNWFSGGHLLDSALSKLGLAKDPDKTYNNPDKALGALMGTFDYDRKYMKAVFGTGKMTEKEFDAKSAELWNVYQPKADAFTKANDKQQEDFFDLSDTEKEVKDILK